MNLFPLLCTSILVIVTVKLSFQVECDPPVGTPKLKPLGSGLGIVGGRVSWFFNPQISTWDGKTDFWWNSQFLNQSLVDEAFGKTIINLANSKDLSSAWDSLFRNFNERKFSNSGYIKGEKIAIKMNINGCEDYESPIRQNAISPQFVKAFLRSITKYGGVDVTDITLYDASRIFSVIYWNKPEGIEDEFPDIQIVDSTAGRSYVSHAAVPDPETNLHFSYSGVPCKDKTFLPKALTNAKYLIQMNAFRGHSLAGLTETGKNWFGSIYRSDCDCNDMKPTCDGKCGRVVSTSDDGKDQPAAYWCPISLHQYVNITGLHARGPHLPIRPMGVYNALVDLLGCDDTAGKGLLFLTDATYGGACQAESCIPLRFQMTPFKNHWSSSIFASVDPIAMDSVLLDFLRNEPSQIYTNKDYCSDNYLHESALAYNPPSGTFYAPSGKQLKSLGVHEHWNDPLNKEYSKNLGIGDGIELVKVHLL